MRDRVITGRHVLFGMLAFFAVVIAANAAFIVLALETFTGLSSEDAYRRGLAYNETLRAAAVQRELGWTARLTFTQRGPRQGRLEVALTDRRGAALDDLSVTADIRRPTHEGIDRAVDFERSGPGRYAAQIDLPLAGQWDVRLNAESRDGARYRLEDRIWLK